MGNTAGDYAKIQQAARNNPELPLTWEKVMQFDSSWDAHPAEKQKIISELEKMQSSQTGQRELREILLKYNEPLTVKLKGEPAMQQPSNQNSGPNANAPAPQRPLGSAAHYEMANHSMEIGAGVFTEMGQKALNMPLDQLLVHEMGHACTVDGEAASRIKTNEDFIVWSAETEKQAEKYRSAYTTENGLPHGRSYADDPTGMIQRVESFLGDPEKQAGAKQELGIDRDDLAAQKLTDSVMGYAIVDEGKTPAEARQKLNEEIDKIKEHTGIDLHDAVKRYLNKPVPKEVNDFMKSEAEKAARYHPEMSKAGGSAPRA